MENFIIDDNGKLIEYRGKDSNVIIPNNVKIIGVEAFILNPYIENVQLPESVTTIEKYAFHSCVNLEIINMPKSIEYIGDHAFDDCKLNHVGKFKAFKYENGNLICRDKIYNEGWNSIEGELKICSNGIHYVKNLFEIFNYYYGTLDKDIIIYEVETQGDEVADFAGYSKTCVKQLKLGKKLSKNEILNLLNT